jgi:ParB family transcriptional regulator, chromosome partitioning protein
LAGLVWLGSTALGTAFFSDSFFAPGEHWMTKSNAVADKVTDNSGPAKASEKLAEKRRALGRGLESLLPGPRVIPPAPTLPQNTRPDGAPDSSSYSSSPSSPASPLSFSSLDSFSPRSDRDRAATPVAPSDGAPAHGTFNDLQAVASGRTADGQLVFLLAPDLIDQNPHQTRRDFDHEALRELADSIAVQGVLQPIVVRPGAEGRFILILGERRLRASKLAAQTTVPVIVKRVSEQQAAEMTLVENLQRADLDCLEQAAAFAKLSTEFKLTQEEIGKRVGVSREQVSNYLRLLKLPTDVHTALGKGQLTYSHARLLLSLDDDSHISKVAQMVIKKKMSVAALEDFVADLNHPMGPADGRKPSGARWVDPNVRAAQRSLETVLGMKVRIRDRRGKGKITIEYGTLEDFDRVVHMLKGK